MIGEVIRKYRKAKNITQEEMAARLGVTPPAVNKWEKGVSQPDISLLAPIARLLDITLDTLLSFNESLTTEEINTIIKDIDKRFKTDCYDDIFKYASGLIRKYPNCYQLIWQLALVLDARLIMDGNADSASYESIIADWYILASECDDPDIRRNAAGSLFQYYIRKENYEKAEQYIQFFSKEGIERKRKQAVIYSKTNRIPEAFTAYEEILFQEYQTLNMVMNSLYMLCMEENNTKLAEMWIEKERALASLFDMGEYRIESCRLELAAYKKDVRLTLHIAKAILDSLPSMSCFTESPMFSHMKFKDADPEFYSGLREKLLELFRDKETFGYMDGCDEWQEIVG